jgi:sulfonate transport system permease protein
VERHQGGVKVSGPSARADTGRLPAAGTLSWRGWVLPLGLVALWEMLTRFNLVNARILARPSLVLATALEQARDGELGSQLGASLARDLGGAALGTLLGIAVGSLMGTSRLSERVLGPSFHAAKQVAIFAWIPLMSVWLGTGEVAKVVFIALAAFYPVVLNTFEGIRSVSREHVEVARVFRFTRWQVFRRVVLPGASPSILAGVQVALVYAWLATIGAEYLLAPAAGIGNLMIDGREQFKMDKVLVGVLVVGGVGLAISSLTKRLEAHVLRWRAPST